MAMILVHVNDGPEHPTRAALGDRSFLSPRPGQADRSQHAVMAGTRTLDTFRWDRSAPAGPAGRDGAVTGRR